MSAVTQYRVERLHESCGWYVIASEPHAGYGIAERIERGPFARSARAHQVARELRQQALGLDGDTLPGERGSVWSVTISHGAGFRVLHVYADSEAEALRRAAAGIGVAMMVRRGVLGAELTTEGGE